MGWDKPHPLGSEANAKVRARILVAPRACWLPGAKARLPAGLLSAHAFATQSPRAKGVASAINIEARNTVAVPIQDGDRSIVMSRVDL